MVGNSQELGAGAHRLVARPAKKTSKETSSPSGPAGVGMRPVPFRGRHRAGPRQIGEMGEEGGGHVLAEGNPVDLFEHAHDVAAWSPGHDSLRKVWPTPAR